MIPIHVGLVGLGAVAHVHAQAYLSTDEVHPVGCFDIDAARVKVFSEQYGIPPCTSLDQLLHTSRLDVVCVLTPARSHEAVVLACAEAGIPILCEKPLALSIASCDRMIAACRKQNVPLCYGASYRYLPAIAKAQQLIAAGEIGEVLVMREWVMGGAGKASRRTMSEAHYPVGGPGGSGMGLIDHGVHLVDVFSWFSGAGITRITGRGNIAGVPQRAEYLLLEYENGALGELMYEDGTFPTGLPCEGAFSWGSGWDADGNVVLAGSWQAHPGSIHVHGTRGSLRILYYANALYLNNAAGLSQIKLSDRAAPAHFATQMSAFAQTIRKSLPPPVGAEAGRDACRVILSVYPDAA